MERSYKYSEDPYVKKRHRSVIQTLLEHNPACHSAEARLSRYNIDLNDAHFYKSKSAKTISLVLPAQGIDLRNQYKTVAALLRGSPFPPVVAVSGRCGPEMEEFLFPEAGFERLSEACWTREARKVAEDIGFMFRKHVRDMPGLPGTYNACHVEA